MNRDPKFETLILKVAQYKVIFKKLPSGKGRSCYFISIWYKPKQKTIEDYKNVDYVKEVFFSKYQDWKEPFPYSFDSDGMWDCLENYKRGVLISNERCGKETNDE
jgi:hypothetical protein